MISEYIRYATNKSERLPLNLRTNKSIAREYCLYLKENNIEIKNADVLVLASWVGIDLSTYKHSEIHSKVKSIKKLDSDVVADFTVPNAHSYTANGIIVHNCNLPESATKELVSEVYMRAWETGCKGFTVYRDKCRDGVLISASEAKSINPPADGRPNDIELSAAPKRPQELICEIKKVKISGEAWTIFVGLFNGKPYEVFGGLSKYVDIPNKYKTGVISKNGKVDGVTTYNLSIGEEDDLMVIKDIANVFENPNFGAFSRTISLALRHGTPVQFVVEQLLKDKHSDITSFSKVIARVLKSYIKDGTKTTLERKCPSCNKEGSFAYQENCLTCLSCGYSKCS
jgi:ribonucleoside-diphosphate reductase alpha chain